MHLWRATFQTGDFGTKRITVTTEDRAAETPAADGRLRGGFAEAEWRALEQSSQETSGWPAPIELRSIEYVNEVPDGPAKVETVTIRRRK